MSVCACGRTTNADRPACDRCAALALFGLTRDATQLEIKDAYRVLAKVWHPDRFPGDEVLRGKAEEKLKEINAAYQLLTTTAADKGYRQAPKPASTSEGPKRAPTTPDDGSHYRPSATGFNASFARKRNWSQRSRKRIALTITVSLLLAGGIWGYSRYQGSMSELLAAFTGANPAKHPTSSSAENDARSRSGSRGMVSDESTGQKSLGKAAAEKSRAGARTKSPSSEGASLVVYPSDDPRVPYFTVGSTKSDVIRVQGPPSQTTGNVLKYGNSEVYFRDGRVASWHTDPGSPLKAKAPE